jgi:hypothetical protein
MPSDTSPPSSLAFEDTLPTGLGVSGGVVEPPRSRLGNSVWADIKRYETEGDGCDLLGVLAACMRHAHSLNVHIRTHGQLEMLSVYPQAQSFLCNLDLCKLPAGDLADLGLVHVEPAGPVPSLDDLSALSRGALRTGQLRLLLWRLAMDGGRAELLPEIAEPARYRLAPALDLLSLPVEAEVATVLDLMHDQPQAVDELARAGPLGRHGVTRLLNALYLQSGLIVTRQPAGPWSLQRAVEAVWRSMPAGFGKRP